MTNYSYFYRSLIREENIADTHYDIFISAFNESSRVALVYDKISADIKSWIYFKEYRYTHNDVKSDSDYFCGEPTESGQIIAFFRNLISKTPGGIFGKSICIDITGFMRPQLLFLVAYLNHINIKEFDIIYTEPGQYTDHENTQFSDGNIVEVRQVNGFEGSHIPDTSNDLLIVGSGYDDKLISSVADDKEHAKKVQLIGFPSLMPDMYQQNLLKVSKSAESLSELSTKKPFFAPANNPFSTASKLSEIVREHVCKYGDITNLYLSPLSTKPQVLGFCLFYIYERRMTGTSIIFPFAEYYKRETSQGYSKILKYRVELPG